MELTVADVVHALEEFYPPATADDWDRVGLVVGDLAAPVRRIHLAVDPTAAVVAEALEAGADLLFTHHPLLLRPIHSVATTTAKGAVVTAAVRGGLALYAAHTNADKAPHGVADALATACGLVDVVPLDPQDGPAGQAVGSGRIGRLPAATTLGELVDTLVAALPATAAGVRVSGPAPAVVSRVAVLGGAGDSYIDAARAAGADVYITADLRHHPVLEARELDRWGPPYLVDAGHWATETLWLGQAARRLARTLGDVQTFVSTLRTDPWTFLAGATGGAR